MDHSLFTTQNKKDVYILARKLELKAYTNTYWTDDKDLKK